MSEGNTIGRCLRRLRREQGLTQEQLAERSGVSVDLIAKLEQGRRETARLTSLMKLANGLDVELSALAGRRDRIGADRDGGSVLAIRDALIAPSLMPGLAGLDSDDDGTPTPLPQLQAAVSAGWRHYWTGQFGPLVAAVPGLITEARITHRSLGVPAVSALAQAFQLAACLMVHLGKDDLAAIGAERGISVAAQGDDEWQWASVVSTLSWVLMYQARLTESENLSVRVAAQIEPTFSAPDAHLAAWGNLLVSAIDTAAVAGKDVTEYVNMAAAGAERIGKRVDAYQTTFGCSKVAVNAVHAHTMLGEPGKALKAAAKVRTADLPRIAYGHHLIDVAQARADLGQRGAATATLMEARELSPVWFRHQGIARSLVRQIREAETRPSPVIRSLVTTLGLEN